MSNEPEEIRVFRYHMASGHVLEEIVDATLTEDDDTLLASVSEIFRSNDFVTVTDAHSESRVLVCVSRIEMVQVGHAIRITHTADSAQEDTAIARAQSLWNQHGEQHG
jgi:hypothetical protein